MAPEKLFTDVPPNNFSPRITDKRGAGQGTPDASPPVPALNERETPHDQAVRAAIQAIDPLKPGDKFWVRHTEYLVASIRDNEIVIVPSGFDKFALKQMKKAVREAI